MRQSSFFKFMLGFINTRFSVLKVCEFTQAYLSELRSFHQWSSLCFSLLRIRILYYTRMFSAKEAEIAELNLRFSGFQK